MSSRPGEERCEVESAVREKLSRLGEVEMQIITEDLINQGMQQGIQQGKRHSLLEVLFSRFEAVSEETRDMIGSIDDEAVLDLLLKRAITAHSLDEFSDSLIEACSR